MDIKAYFKTPFGSSAYSVENDVRLVLRAFCDCDRHREIAGIVWNFGNTFFSRKHTELVFDYIETENDQTCCIVVTENGKTTTSFPFLLKTIHAVQGDTGRTIECVVSGTTIENGSSAVLWVERPNGSVWSVVGSITGNTISFDIPSGGAFTQIGTAKAQAKITYVDTVTSTFEFVIEVHENISGTPTQEDESWRDQLTASLQGQIGTLDGKINNVEAELLDIVNPITEYLSDKKIASKVINASTSAVVTCEQTGVALVAFAGNASTSALWLLRVTGSPTCYAAKLVNNGNHTETHVSADRSFTINGGSTVIFTLIPINGTWTME
ncbi:unnamed protein product [Cylicocyclus nassatus]|uniref:BppU N-terminal domain-containing protein n=1 Tax=Cylicocyclus nassatus TaxID=53992 RepID=A0AA36GQU2_CYLNA|nr:unnamed protein product [Cylicocyclus nassatus]